MGRHVCSLSLSVFLHTHEIATHKAPLPPAKMDITLAKKVLLMGTGMATGAYDIFVINMVLLILTPLYGTQNPDNQKIYSLEPWQKSALATAAVAGTMMGQLVFGLLGDILGRRNSGIITCSLLVIGAFGCASSFSLEATLASFFIMMSAWRFLIGMGVGGEYPVTAIFTSESATDTNTKTVRNAAHSGTNLRQDSSVELSEASPPDPSIQVEAIAEETGKQENSPAEVEESGNLELKVSKKAKKKDSNTSGRGMALAAMFSFQGIGQTSSCLVMLLLLIALGIEHLEWIWRIAFAVGGIPPLIILYPRLKLSENQSFKTTTKTVTPDIMLIIKHYGIRMIGTAGSWLLFDIVFYGNSLFLSELIKMAGLASGSDYRTLRNNVLFNLGISMLALPGYWTAVYLIDRIGRKTLQIAGLVAMGTLYLLIGFFFDTLIYYPIPFVLLYGATYYFANVGPNTTTFIIPTETYPAMIRSTCHGLSAASGKFGAVIGGACMPLVIQYLGVGWTLVACGALAFLATVLTVFTVEETMGKDMDALEAEARAIFAPPTAGIPSVAELEVTEIRTENQPEEKKNEQEEVVPVDTEVGSEEIQIELDEK